MEEFEIINEEKPAVEEKDEFKIIGLEKENSGETGSSVNTEKKQRTQRVKSEKSGGMVFAPGTSGNPAGRPKGSVNFSTLFDRVARKIAADNKITEEEAVEFLITMAFKEAKRGNFNFYKDLMDRKFGKPVESIHVAGALAGEVVHYHIPFRQTAEEWMKDIKKIQNG